MVEQWKNVIGYEGLYEVSNLGNVRSLDRYTNAKNNKVRLVKGKLLKSYKLNSGYLIVDLYISPNRRKHHLVHRLVAEAFIQNPYNLEEVNHIDENKSNNVVSNLQWCNKQYNNSYGTKNERAIKTKIERGYCYGLTKQEVKMLYYYRHREEINRRRREKYKLKKQGN